jgi:spore coat-associated protein N
MQRFAAVWHASPRKLMGALLLLLLAAGMAVGSGASFTAQSASPGNMVTAGSLSIDNDHEGGSEGAIFTINNLRPGQSDFGYVTVKNTGTVPGAFNLGLTGKTAGGAGADLSNRLHLKVEEVNPSTNAVTGTVFSDAVVNTMGTTNALGTWNGGDTHKYKFTVAWPSGLSADDAYQGSTLQLDFRWDAVSS